MTQDNWMIWMKRLRPVLFLCAVIGLVLSLAVHIVTFFNINPGERWPYIWWLHIGIFLIMIPEVVIENREQIDYLNAEDCPQWLNIMVAIFGVYAFINFGLFFLLGEEFGISEARGFSGHWMIFYAAGVKMLYSALFSPKKTSSSPNSDQKTSERLLIQPQSQINIPDVQQENEQRKREDSSIEFQPHINGPAIQQESVPPYSIQFFFGAPLRGAIFVFFFLFLYNVIPLIVAEGEGTVAERIYRSRKRGNLIKLKNGTEVVVVSSEEFWQDIQQGDFIEKKKWGWIYLLNQQSYNALWHVSKSAVGIGIFAFLFWTIGLHISWWNRRRKSSKGF